MYQKKVFYLQDMYVYDGNWEEYTHSIDDRTDSTNASLDGIWLAVTGIVIIKFIKRKQI